MAFKLSPSGVAWHRPTEELRHLSNQFIQSCLASQDCDKQEQNCGPDHWDDIPETQKRAQFGSAVSFELLKQVLLV